MLRDLDVCRILHHGDVNPGRQPCGEPCRSARARHMAFRVGLLLVSVCLFNLESFAIHMTKTCFHHMHLL
jgi:hypothetical protein